MGKNFFGFGALQVGMHTHRKKFDAPCWLAQGMGWIGHIASARRSRRGRRIRAVTTGLQWLLLGCTLAPTTKSVAAPPFAETDELDELAIDLMPDALTADLTALSTLPPAEPYLQWRAALSPRDAKRVTALCARYDELHVLCGGVGPFAVRPPRVCAAAGASLVPAAVAISTAATVNASSSTVVVSADPDCLAPGAYAVWLEQLTPPQRRYVQARCRNGANWESTLCQIFKPAPPLAGLRPPASALATPRVAAPTLAADSEGASVHEADAAMPTPSFGRTTPHAAAAYRAWLQKLPLVQRKGVAQYCRTVAALESDPLCNGIGPLHIPPPPGAQGVHPGWDAWFASLTKAQLRYWHALCHDEGNAFSELCGATPLLVQFDDTPVKFTRVRANDARFAIVPGVAGHFDWPTARTPWLALDRNGNGIIDDGGELFGSGTRLANGGYAPHGFAALAELDANDDGRIDANDPAFARLLLWGDTNANRASEPAELAPVASRLHALSLNYERVPRCDARGNCIREQSRAEPVPTGVFVVPAASVPVGCAPRARLVDVYLRPQRVR